MWLYRNARVPLQLALVAGALACSGPAAAQDRSGTVEITPFGGGYFGGTLYAGSNAIFNRDVKVRSAGTFGLRIGVNATRWLGLEAGFSTARANIEGSGAGLFGSTNKLGDLDAKHYELNAVFNLSRRRVIPYITLGGGATTFRALVPGFDADEDTRFTANLGLGVKVFFNPHVALRFESRGRSAYVNNTRRCSIYYSGYCDGGYHYDDDRRRWYGSGEATGGLTVAF